jgi:flavin-dependent dehydrogenase
MIDADVVVVGGGPAGSACAWKLGRCGIEAIVLDKKAAPGDTVCAGWITPGVLRDLEFGVEEYPHGLLTLRELHLRFKAKRVAVRTRQYSIRRCEFDRWLLERTGAPVYRHTVDRIRKENGRYVIDERFRCKYLVGAGGTYCPVYRTFFRDVNPRAGERLITAMGEEFLYDYRDDRCCLWFSENGLPGYSWYVPKSDGYLNIGIGGKFAVLRSRGETIRTHWARLVQKLEEDSLVKRYSHQPRGRNYYLRQNVEVVRLENAFITGDAAGLATLDMGEGIGPAVESGIRAARAIISGGPYTLKSIGKFSAFGILFPWWKR